ncbi:hypothetical protein HanRHA438_Chr15g0688031 [Helianthus annuus]|uniref:Uncharacterized protein n=1 Tax=Helianthus annuus TaxID=4232 RepID=A0A9K3H1H2_HELAN|nr:hypothetical protein HanXRQr2_Chr15g0675611 [Helianthus annuus]KAJ0829827.1 hypothetical protein HanPSC8_Chr15g0648241 [Helianthus annuus]KAJ0843132.1 hypothetical protein HanRHA438_Chr15g0688031 [Helianthus annuus]
MAFDAGSIHIRCAFFQFLCFPNRRLLPFLILLIIYPVKSQTAQSICDVFSLI